jgi:hypothetical protein
LTRNHERAVRINNKPINDFRMTKHAESIDRTSNTGKENPEMLFLSIFIRIGTY